MKVLWFTNTPANADEFFNSELKSTGGWIKALDQAIQRRLELHVAFYKDYPHSFQYKDSYYHPIKPDNSFINRSLNRFFNFSFSNDSKKYLEIVNQVKPDIIHIHGTENSFSDIISYTNIPVVLSIQGNITVILHKYCSGFEKKYLKTKIRKFSSLKDFLFPWFFYVEWKEFHRLQKREILNLKNVNYIIGRTEWDKRISRVLAPNSKYFHEDRVLRDLFYINKWKQHERSKTIIHTTNGNFFYKGFETLCLALHELNVIGINCEWRVAGISEKDLIVKITKKHLKSKFPSMGLKLLGNINEKELVSNLLEADLYVMTSHIENNANNLCEAMILGLPCISTFVGGMGSLIRNNIEGILIQSGDPWAMAGAVIELIQDKHKALELGDSARKAALHRHDKKRIINGIISTYHEIIDGN